MGSGYFCVADDRGEVCIQPFIHKLHLWRCTLGKGSFASFLKQKECKALSTDNIHPSCHCQSLEWTAAESIFHNEIPMGVVHKARNELRGGAAVSYCNRNGEGAAGKERFCGLLFGFILRIQ